MRVVQFAFWGLVLYFECFAVCDFSIVFVFSPPRSPARPVWARNILNHSVGHLYVSRSSPTFDAEEARASCQHVFLYDIDVARSAEHI